jgi:hypothetical protein
VAGTYYVTVTDDHGCIKMDSAIINQPAELTITVDSTIDVLCYGGNEGDVNISVNGGTPDYTYIWSNDSTTQDINNLVAGTYYVTVTDDNSCTKIDSATINQPTEISISYITTHICYGENNGAIDLNVSGGTPPYTYNWSTGAATKDIDSLIADTYYVTVTDNHGCIKIDSVTIIESLSPVSIIHTSNNVLCNGDNTGSIDLYVSGSIPPYIYNWSDGSSTQNIDSLTANTYFVTVTDSIGCIAIDSVVIIEPPELDISYISTNVSCYQGNNGTIDINISGGTPPYNYYWSNGAVTEDINGLIANTYTVFVVDSNGCTLISSIIIEEPTPVIINYIITNACYNSNNGAIDLDVSGGTPTYSYNWSNGPTTQDINNLTAGTYYITVIDNNLCISVDSAIITEAPSEISINYISTDVLCNGGNTGSIDLDISGSVPPYIYNWSNGSSTQDIDNLIIGTYYITVTDSFGCIAIDSITINEPSPLMISFNVIDDSTGNCLGKISAVVSGGTPTYHYNWYDPQLQTTATADSLCGGYYMVAVTDSNGCTISDTVFVQSGDVYTPGQSNIYSNFKVYPNPNNNGKFVIELNDFDKQNAELQLYNGIGKIIYSEELEIYNKMSKEIDLLDKGPGIYYLRLTLANEKVLTQKLVVY